MDLAECGAVKGEFRAHLDRFPAHSVLIVPLRAQHTPIGTLSIVRDYLRKLFTIHDQVFLQGIVNQLAMAVEKTHACRQLTEREQRLLDLLERLQVAKVMERRQVVYEVHDGLAQMAGSVHQHLQAFAHSYPQACPEGREQLERTLNLAHRTVCEARNIVAGLRPTVLDDFGLAAAIGMLVEEFTQEGWEISYHEDLEGYRVPPLIALHLYRVALEALANVRKHAGAGRVRVRLRHDREKVSLEVHDWGKGFVRDSASLEMGNGAHLRLSSMRERIRWLGGRFPLESQPGRGTTVTAEVPLCLTMPGVVTGIEASTPADC